MWNDDEIEGEGNQSRKLLDLWELLNDLDSLAERRTESLVAKPPENAGEEGEKLILRRRRRVDPYLSDDDGSEA